MRLPRLILNPAIRPWLLLWQRERQENARLRRELRGWQDKTLEMKNVTPLFTPPPKPEPTQPRLVGQAAKNAYLAQQTKERESNNPTAEQVLGTY